MAKVILVNDDGTQEEFEKFVLFGFDDEKNECTEMACRISIRKLMLVREQVQETILEETIKMAKGER